MMTNKKGFTRLNITLIILSIIPYLFTIAKKEGWLHFNLKILYVSGFAIVSYLLVVMLFSGKKYLGNEVKAKVKFRKYCVYDLNKIIVAIIIGYTLIDDKLLPEKSTIHYLYFLLLSLFFLLHLRLRKIE